MTTPADRFVEAMRMLTKGAMPMELLYLRTLAVAFVDESCDLTIPPHEDFAVNDHHLCVTDFLKRCGLEE